GLQDALWAAGITNTHFTIVGDGSEREWLQNRLPGAEFTGVIRGDRLADAYANLDLFVFPSETETVGNVVLEAMASGVPVVAMSRGGPKFITAATDAAVLARSPQELADLVARLALDPNRRREMGAAGRATALERSWRTVFDGVYHAYDVALAGAGHADSRLDSPAVAVSGPTVARKWSAA